MFCSSQKRGCQRQASHLADNATMASSFDRKLGFCHCWVFKKTLHEMISLPRLYNLLYFASGLCGVQKSGRGNLRGDFLDALSPSLTETAFSWPFTAVKGGLSFFYLSSFSFCTFISRLLSCIFWITLICFLLSVTPFPFQQNFQYHKPISTLCLRGLPNLIPHL